MLRTWLVRRALEAQPSIEEDGKNNDETLIIYSSFIFQTKTNNQDDSKNKAASVNASAIFGPILGVLGLICIIGVVCVVVVKYRKRK